ncbi:protein serine/threonine phosphatase 2C, partial [Aureobasidium melanogenum]
MSSNPDISPQSPSFPPDTEKATATTQSSDLITYPEGGTKAWLVVFGAWCGLTASIGVYNTTGVFSVIISSSVLPTTSASSLGWIFSIYAFVVWSVGVWVGPFLGMVCLSFCTEYYQIFLAFSLLTGLGSSLLLTPSMACVARWFDARRGLASGIAWTGSGFGGVLFPLVIQALLPQLGWSWGIRVVSFILLALCILSVCFCNSRIPATPPKDGISPWRATLPDYRIFLDGTGAMAVTTLGTLFTDLAYYIPITYLPAYYLTRQKISPNAGITGSAAFGYQLLAILNAASCFGRLTSGTLGDHFGHYNTMIVSLFLCAVSVLASWMPDILTQDLSSPALLIVFVILFGLTRPSFSQSGTNGVRYTAITASTLSGLGGIWWFTKPTRDLVPVIEIQEFKHILKTSDLSSDGITRILSQEAYSFPVKGVSGVDRYDGTQLASNGICEDRFIHGKLPSPRDDGKPWMAWAVFDGHAGWQTADLLEKQLVPLVQQYLRQASLTFGDQSGYKEAVQHAITKAFVDLDSSIVETAQETAQSNLPFQEKMQKLLPAFAGSCALLSLYDPVTSSLHVACTGDSRAVLGQKLSDGTWVATPLSIDQTGSNTSEISRIQHEHPKEDSIIKNGRVLGLMASRAFGDGRWKWSEEVQNDMMEKFEAPSLSPGNVSKTPPYVTAEPVVTSTVIDTKTPCFVIIASDGLWDMLTDQQAVTLVSSWLDSQTPSTTPNTSSTTPSNPSTANPTPTYPPFTLSSLSSNPPTGRFSAEKTVLEDKENVAVHLLRNSLGGNHEELIGARLTATYPYSRDLRDDITVQVAFFGCQGV